MGFVGNLLGFPAVKEFWKSVKNWQSYCHEFGVQFSLAHPVYLWLRVSLVFDHLHPSCCGTMGNCCNMCLPGLVTIRWIVLEIPCLEGFFGLTLAWGWGHMTLGYEFLAIYQKIIKIIFRKRMHRLWCQLPQVVYGGIKQSVGARNS